MNKHVLILFIVCVFATYASYAQTSVSGTVYDSTKINLVQGVKVQTTSGKFTLTDSLGKYALPLVAENDSIYFTFNAKSTPKYALKSMANPTQFDIQLHVKVKSKYTTLKEVVVYGNNYKQDSIENRLKYAKVFDFRKNKIGSSVTPMGGVGLDINDLINLFRFRRNKQLKAFRERLEREEKERYVNYRFNKTLVTRITNLKSAALDAFMIKYRPDYEFVKQCDELLMNEYIIRAWYHYKQQINDFTAPKKEGELPPLY